MKRSCHGCLALVMVVVVGGCGGDLASVDEEDGGGGGAVTPDGSDPIDAVSAPPDADTSFPFVRCDASRMPLPPLVEDRTVYQQDELGVWTVHLTVTDLAGLDEVNAGIVDAEVAVVFSDGELGIDAVEPNATLRIRGGASRVNVQKNYKVELSIPGERWRGQKEINLNKHMWDLTRVRNKLAFDLFQTVPDLTSLRTQFVQMFVNGEDHGLYTWIEEPDSRFLASHGLDPDGQLYKAASFWFQDIDPTVAADPAAFELLIEAKANPDHVKLLRMTAAVNDEAIDIDQVVDTYFNRDNLVTWLATNVLLNNIDTRTQNYYLYSPSSCEGWYLLPWDYDGAWGFYGQLSVDDRERWESGLSNWWIVRLFERFYRRPANVQAIHDKIVELSETALTDAAVAERIASYHDLVLGHIAVQPDLQHLPGHHGNAPPSVGIELWEGELARIATTTSRFLAEYQAVVERPMPSHIAANVNASPMTFRWDDSFDLQHDPLSYDLQVSRTEAFAPSDLVVEQLGLVGDQASVGSLPSGTYFWRVLIRDHPATDTWQLPFDPHKVLVIP